MDLQPGALVFRHGRVASELAGEALTKERIIERCYRRRWLRDGQKAQLAPSRAAAGPAGTGPLVGVRMIELGSFSRGLLPAGCSATWAPR